MSVNFATYSYSYSATSSDLHQPRFLQHQPLRIGKTRPPDNKIDIILTCDIIFIVKKKSSKKKSTFGIFSILLAL